MDQTHAEVRAMTKEELIREHDRKAANTSVGLNFYLDEIARRETEAATAEIVRMTRTLKGLTWVIAALTVILVALAVFEQAGTP